MVPEITLRPNNPGSGNRLDWEEHGRQHYYSLPEKLEVIPMGKCRRIVASTVKSTSQVKPLYGVCGRVEITSRDAKTNGDNSLNVTLSKTQRT